MEAKKECASLLSIFVKLAANLMYDLIDFSTSILLIRYTCAAKPNTSVWTCHFNESISFFDSFLKFLSRCLSFCLLLDDFCETYLAIRCTCLHIVALISESG